MTTGTGKAPEEACDLVEELASAMHGVSIPSNQIEDVLGEVSTAIGASTQVLVLQSAVLLQVDLGDQRRVAMLRIPFESHWHIEKLHQIVDIGQDLVDRRLGVSAARAAIARIKAQPALHSSALVLAGHMAYGWAASARCGGRWLEMLIGAVVGLIVGSFAILSSSHPRIDLQKSFTAGFIGTLTVLAISLVAPRFGFAPALYGGILLLVPSSVLTVGISEVANGALEAGVPRLTNALLGFAFLAAGIAAALKGWAFFHPLPPLDQTPPLPKPLVLAILGSVGAAALTVVLQVRWRDFAWVAGGVWLAYGSQELAEMSLSGRAAPLMSAFLVAVGAQLQNRFTGRSPALVFVPGLLQLTPGFLGTTAVLRMLAGMAKPGDDFSHVMLKATQLSLGFLLAHVFFRPHALARRTRATEPAT